MSVSERTLAAFALSFALGLSACSSQLDLGHDLKNRVTLPRPTPDTGPVADAGDAAPDAPTTAPIIPHAPDEPTPPTCVGIPCFRGPALVLATSTGNAKGLVVDADNAFWAATAGEAVMITPMDGTPTTTVSTTTLVQTANAGPFRVAGDDTFVYFTSATGGYVAVMPKRAQPRLGPRLTPRVTLLASGEPEPQSIVVGDDGIYYADGKADTVKRVSAADHQPAVTIATGIAPGSALAIDGTAIYYVDSAAGEIHSIDRVSYANTRIAAGLHHPVAPVLRGDQLYFLELGTEKADYTDGRLLRLPRAGGPVAVLMDELDAPTGLTADTAAVYLCERGNDTNGFLGRIVRLADDGEVSTLAVDQAEPFAIAVDGNGVYWTADADNGLHSIAR